MENKTYTNEYNSGMILPISTPPITAYQQIALPLSVAMQNMTFSNWFYSNYIQVSCVNRNHYVLRGNTDNALHYSYYNPEITFPDPLDHISLEGCEQLYFFRKPYSIIESISDGWYIYTDADMFFIDGSDGYKEIHHPHDMLIYGCNENYMYIYMYDKLKLTSHIVSYDHFLDGYYSKFCHEDIYRNRAILLKPNTINCAINLEKIRWYMNDYLNGTETFARERPNIFNPNSLTMNGMDTYTEFDNLLDYVLVSENKHLRRTDFYCLYEHKKIMFDRVIYLNKQGMLYANSDLINEFGYIKDLSHIIMMLGLKIGILNDINKINNSILSIKKRLIDMRNLEERTWNRYISTNKEILG